MTTSGVYLQPNLLTFRHESVDSDSKAEKTKENNGNNIFNTAVNTTVGIFSADSFDEFIQKQNYTMLKGLSQFYNGVLEAGEGADEVYDNKKEPFSVKETSLSKDKQAEIREYTIELLKARYQLDHSARPDYGDCSEYYNYGSPLDWIFTHATLVVDKMLGEDSGYHKFMYEQSNNGEGMFSLANIPYHILDNAFNFEEYDEDGIRQDTPADFLKFKTIYAIDDDLAKKEEILKDLEANKDNPEEFARLFYLITDGTNFNPDKIDEYKIALENNEDTKPLDTLLGRDYIKEDYAKNKIGTNTAFSINKMAGTAVAKKFLGPTPAFAINAAVSLLDLYTREEEPEFDEVMDTLTTEACRSYLTGLHLVKNGLLNKGIGLLRFGANKSGILGDSAKGLNNLFGENNMHDKLAQDEYLNLTDVAKITVNPLAPAEVAYSGYIAGSSAIKDYNNENYEALKFDIANILLNPVAMVGFLG